MALRTRPRLSDQQVLQEVGDILTLSGTTQVPIEGILKLHEYELDLREATEGDVLMVELGKVITKKISGRTHGYDKIYYVSPLGDDSKAVPGDYLKTYKTINAASDAAVDGIAQGYEKVMVYVQKGVYQESDICRDRVDMYFEKGAVVYSLTAGQSVLSDRLFIGGVKTKIKGKGRFYHKLNNPSTLSDAVNFQFAGSKLQIEAEEVSSIQLGPDYSETLLLKEIKYLAPLLSVGAVNIDIDKCKFMEGLVLPLSSNIGIDVKRSDIYFKNNPYTNFEIHKIYDEDNNFLFDLDQYHGTSVQPLAGIHADGLLEYGVMEGIVAVDFLNTSGIENTSVLIENCTVFLQKEKSVGVSFKATGNNVLKIRLKGVEIIDETEWKETVAVGMGKDSIVTTPVILGLSGVSHNCKIGKHWSSVQSEIQESIRTLGETTIGTARDGEYGKVGMNAAGLYAGMERDEAFDRINSLLDEVAPANPPYLSDKIFETESFSALKAGTTTEFDHIIYNTRPTIKVTGPDNDSFFKGDRGVISASVRDGSTNITTSSSKTLSQGDDSGVVGPDNVLNIISDTPYNALWKALTAEVQSQTPLTTGEATHLYRIEHSETGFKEFSFFVDDENTPVISDFSISGEVTPLTTHKISGVSSWSAETILTVGFTASNVISYFYNKNQIVQVESEAITQTVKAPASDSYQTNTPVIAYLPVVIREGYYNDDTPFIIKGFNAGGTATGTLTGQSQVYVDTLSDETIRVSSGSGTYPGPVTPSIVSNKDGAGAPYNSEESLLLNEELQLIGAVFQYPPPVNYSTHLPAGPDYSNLTSVRWATFKIGEVSGQSKVIFTIINGEGFSFSGIDGTINNSGLRLLMYISGVDGTSGWVDVNKGFYNPRFVPDLDGDPAFDAGNSENSEGKNISRVANFGTNSRSGEVYVRIGLQNGSMVKFSNIILKEQ